MPDRRRNSIESAVVLKSARMGEIHRRVTLFTSRRGLVYAIAHGAGKAVSKLKAAAVAFAHVTVYLYHDPMRDTFKVTDAEPRNLHGAIRGDLEKFFTASLWVETVLRSHGGGAEPEPLHALLVSGLDVLDGAAAAEVGPLSVQFLWRALAQLGIGPELDGCAGCGRRLAADEELAVAPDGGSRCRRCIRAAGTAGDAATAGTIGTAVPAAAGALWLDGAGRRFLRATERLELRDALRYRFAGSEGLRRSLQHLLQHGLERPLNSLRCAGGIL